MNEKVFIVGGKLIKDVLNYPLLSIIKMDLSMDSMVTGNESKKLGLPAKAYSQEGLIPLTLKMLGECLRKKSKQIDGHIFNRIVLMCRIDCVEPRSSKW